MKKLAATVLVKTPAGEEEHDVEIRWPDQVLVEREGHRHGITVQGTPMQATQYMVWAALQRTGRYAGDYQQFATVDLLDLEAHESLAVDPTPPAPSAGSS